MQLGEVINQYRLDHGVSQREFAARAGISAAQVCRLESGINSKGSSFLRPTIETVQKCARAMNMPFEKLYDIVFDQDVTVRKMSQLEYDLIKAYRVADPILQQAIIDILHLHKE